MSSSTITTRDGGTITVAPRNEAQQSALVVIAHGLGDTAEGFVDVAEVSVVVVVVVSLDFYLQYIAHTNATLVFSKRIALRQVYSSNGSHQTRHYEYGNAHALVVRHYRVGRTRQ